MDRYRSCCIVRFLMNGEEEYVNVYEHEDDADKDVDTWCLTNNGNKDAYTISIQHGCLQGMPFWPDLKRRRDALEDTILEWLHEGIGNEWSNVIASITSSTLDDVREALLRAEKAKRLLIDDVAHTSLGPIYHVRVPFPVDRIIWALLDTEDAVWSDEMASANGDALSEVNGELEELRKVDAVEVLETRQTPSGPSVYVRLEPAERDRLLKREWMFPPK